ncbi:MAG: SRPBCC family protein [Saprospiraceae bacterium]
MYQYKTEQWLPISIEEAWRFFSSPQNLSTITPPEMEFKILSNPESKIYEGMRIDYRVRPILGIPMYWQTEISHVQNEKHFVDKQLKGPYKKWEHTHTFTEKNGGVLVEDEIRYALPFSFIGRITHELFVRKKIENIFNFRKNILTQIFIKK